MKNDPAKSRQYAKFKRGDGVALLDLLEEERGPLFDYLLRMTGQVARSVETIDEVFMTLGRETLATVDTYSELRVCLFVTGRKFNADIWHADTSQLANLAFEVGGAVPKATSAPVDHLAQSLDRFIRGLPGVEREAIYLEAVAGFDNEERSEIMGRPAFELAEAAAKALKLLRSEFGHESLNHLKPHPLPQRSSHATIDLSMVMQGIKAKPAGIWSPVRLTVLLIIAGLAVLLWFFPEYLGKLRSWFD